VPFVALVVASSAALAPPVAAAAPTTGEDVVLSGVYSEDWESGADLTALGSASGKRVSIQGSFHDIGQSAQNVDWILEQAWSAQSTPFANVTIQATAGAIAAGAHDAAIASFAAKVKAWTDRGSGRSLFVAPLQEMNGDWTPYGMDPGAFRVAYGKFVDSFRRVGLDETTVRFVFAPNGWSTPPYQLADYYPGDDIVDLIGFSAYNFGTSIDRWTTVGETLNGVVAELRTFAPSKPYVVAQVASSTFGGDRDAWIRDLFAYTADHPNVVGFIWFNLDKETDWRIWDGSTVAAGWRDGMQMATTIEEWPLTAWFQSGRLPFSPDRATWTGTFRDDDASEFESDIEWLVAAGITQGCDATNHLYCPTAAVARDQMAAFLTRALGLTTSASHSFTDVGGSTFESEIAAVAAAGITQGCTADGTRFCPADPVTRGEMAAFLVRALQLPTGAANTFVDDDGSLFEADIAAVAAAGITRGCTADGTRFCPTDPVSRGQMAAFLRRALG
ncbi:MAG TPA: S-layer homology domain-containing protein, partial [Acidimicrobiia bacterium]|nr:S-layer homology domain-containing protein [Acidimicrobiia bacterium]